MHVNPFIPSAWPQLLNWGHSEISEWRVNLFQRKQAKGNDEISFLSLVLWCCVSVNKIAIETEINFIEVHFKSLKMNSRKHLIWHPRKRNSELSCAHSQATFSVFFFSTFLTLKFSFSLPFFSLPFYLPPYLQI